MAKPPADCAIATCERKLVPPYGRGMCSLHYKRWRKHGDPNYVQDRHKWDRTCSIEKCDKPTLSRSWCSAHWTRWQRHGSPTARLRGEVLNGCRACPACGQDVPISQYTEGLMSPCRACVARRAWTRRTFIPGVPKRYLECTCRACDSTFMGNAKQCTFCSRECFEAYYGKRCERRRQLLKQVEHEKFSRAEIFDRDQWTCGVCNEGVDPELSWPDRMCAVVDHVIPVSKGGAHTRANVQTAHNLCNARKGARLQLKSGGRDGNFS